MSPSRNSRATQELIRLLAGEGIQMSPRQVERWSEEGPIPKAGRRRNGRKGTEAILAPHTIEYVHEAFAIQRIHRPLHHVVLIMFLRGREIASDKLRHAFRKRLAEHERKLQRFTQGRTLMDAGEKAADEIVKSLPQAKEGRAVLSRLNDYRETLPEEAREPVLELARSVYTNLFLLASGVRVEDAAIREIIEASGLASMEKVAGGIGPVVPEVPMDDFRRAAEQATLPARKQAIRTASPDDLKLAAALVRHLGCMASEFSLYCRRLRLDRDAFGYIVLADHTEIQLVDEIPTTVIKLRDKAWRRNARQRIKWLKLAVPQYRAINELLPELPRRYWKWMRPDRKDWLEVVPEAELQKLRALLDPIFQRRPELKVAVNQEIWDQLDELEDKIEDIN